MLQEFKPSLLFLARFLIMYVVGNLIYGVYVESFDNQPDPITEEVTVQSAAVLRLAGAGNVHAESSRTKPTVDLKVDGNKVLGVFEGCNGLNVMIVFVAFLVAFGGQLKKYWWFIPAGIVVIHVFNLFRIGLLYYAALEYQSYFYYVHKYFFTAIIYLVVFVLWAIWIMKFNRVQQHG